MAFEQLSIWDNSLLEQGYRSLSALRFSEAALQFREALKASNDRKTLEEALAACEFWRLKIPVQPNTQTDAGLIVQDFVRYPFSGSLLGLRRALLLHIAETAGNTKQISLPLLETIFDLLLALPDLPAAMQLVRQAISWYPGEKYLLYSLGQVLWRNNNKSEAKVNYIRACLLHPDGRYCKRIEIEAAKIPARQHGVAWIPAYGWIHGFLPLISLPEAVSAVDEVHQQAVDVYRLLYLSEEAARKKDLKSCIRCRKEIKDIKPDLYETYFRLLRRRKGLLLLTGR